MSDFRKVAHLEEQLGPARFRILLDPDNTGEVKNFCDEFFRPLPAEITIGGRTYEILRCSQSSDVEGLGVVWCAERLGANLGQEDGEFFLAHQDELEISAILRRKASFIFTDWRDGQDTDTHLAAACWDGSRYVLRWLWIGNGQNWRYGYFLRRKA